MKGLAAGSGVVLLAGALVACGEPTPPASEVVVTEGDSAGVRTLTISGPVEALPEWGLSATPVTEIRGSAPPFLGSVGEVELLGDGTLLVHDRQSAELHSFAPDGELLRRVARAGDGPGEFRALVQLSVTPGDTVHAFDRRHGRISTFDPDRSFQSAVVIASDLAAPDATVQDVWALGQDRLLLHGVTLGGADPPDGSALRVERQRVIRIVSPEGNELTPPVRFAGEFVVRGPLGEVGSPFSNRPFVDVNAHRILHASGRTYELVLRDFDLRPRLVIRWSGWQRPLTPSAIEDLRAPMDASLSDLRAVNPDAADQLLGALVEPDAVPEFLPALGSGLLDDLGRIWVGRFRPTSDLRVATTGGYEAWDQEDVWHVLEPDGTPLARMRLPPRTRLLAVRGDRVAVVARDSLGVEHVRVLRIESGVGAH